MVERSVERKRPTLVQRRFSLTHADLGTVIPAGRVLLLVAL